MINFKSQTLGQLYKKHKHKILSQTKNVEKKFFRCINVVKFGRVGRVVSRRCAKAVEAAEGLHGSAREQATEVLSWVTAGGSMGDHGWSSKNAEEDHHGNHTKWTVDRGLLFVFALILTSPNNSIMLIF